MKVVEAVQEIEKQNGEIWCFLAGGITNCPDWQDEVISNLKAYDAKFPGTLDRLVILNPRRKNFPIDDPNASLEQITWEFNQLQQMDIFSMYFTAGPSDQPICLYELGRNIKRMQDVFNEDFDKRIIISCDPGYKRAADVKIQTKLAFDHTDTQTGKSFTADIIDKADPLEHMYHIIRAYERLRDATV